MKTWPLIYATSGIVVYCYNLPGGQFQRQVVKTSIFLNQTAPLLGKKTLSGKMNTPTTPKNRHPSETAKKGSNLNDNQQDAPYLYEDNKVYYVFGRIMWIFWSWKEGHHVSQPSEVRTQTNTVKIMYSNNGYIGRLNCRMII